MKRRQKKVSIYAIIVGTLLAIYTIAIIGMMVWALGASLKTADSYAADPVFPNADFYFENYITAFLYGFDKVIEGVRHVYIEGMFLNSLIYSAGGALFQAFGTSLAAYLIAKYDCKFSRFMHNLIIVTMIIPIIGSLPSLAQVMDVLHIRNTFIGTFIMHFGFTNTYYLIFYAAYKSISWNYAESAFIDGASHYQVFFRIMMPLTSSLFGTTFILFFIGYWNDYQVPMLFLGKNPVLALGLYEFFQSYSNQLSVGTVKIAGGVIVLIPLLILFIVFRKKLMGNLTEGGIKG